MSGAATTIRAAIDEDTPAILAIWGANGLVIPPGGADTLSPYVAHMLRSGRVLVALDPDGAVAAFGAVAERSGVTHLADLFVRPDRLGRGIGRPLLAALFGAAERRTTFASSDPRALPLYARAGMAPLWPSLHLDVDIAQLPPTPPGLTVSPAGPDDVAGLEARWLGAADRRDHALWAALPEARPFVVTAGGRPVAAGHARARREGEHRWINRLVIAPDAEPAPVVLAAHHHAAEGGRIGSCLPGPSPALRPLLDAGARIIDRDTFMASDPTLFDTTRRISDGGFL
jgi:GNAT superfamily N-acetyltransferase